MLWPFFGGGGEGKLKVGFKGWGDSSADKVKHLALKPDHIAHTAVILVSLCQEIEVGVGVGVF